MERRADTLEATLGKLSEAGAEITVTGDAIRVARRGPLSPFNLRTAPFPGFPTDMQAQMMAVATRAAGTSIITETIFENRMMHVQELVRLGAGDRGRRAIRPSCAASASSTGADVMATDLRASACLVIAGLMAEGATTIDRIYHLDRGYERIEESSRCLGAQDSTAVP